MITKDVFLEETCARLMKTSSDYGCFEEDIALLIPVFVLLF